MADPRVGEGMRILRMLVLASRVPGRGEGVDGGPRAWGRSLLGDLGWGSSSREGMRDPWIGESPRSGEDCGWGALQDGEERGACNGGDLKGGGVSQNVLPSREG